MEMTIPPSPTEILLEGLDRKSWWNQRSPFERKLIIILIAAGVILFGILLYIAVRTPGKDNVCITKECIKTASQISDHIDPTINPCENFFQFACGKIINETGRTWDTRPYELLREKIKDKLLFILKNTIKDQDSYELKIEKKLFQGCTNKTEAEHNSLQIFKNLLEKLEGWPIVVGSKWNSDHFDWVKTILTLRNEGYYHNMFFSIYMGNGHGDYFDNMLTIAAPFVNRYRDLVMNKKLIVEAAALLGANQTFAVGEVNDIYNFNAELFKVVNVMALYKSSNFKTVNVGELQNEDTKIDWLEFLNLYLNPHVNLKEGDHVLIETRYFKDFHDLIDKTPVRIISNFIIWKVIERVMPFLSKDFNDIWKKYSCLEHSEEGRQDYCFNIVRKSPGLYKEYIKTLLSEKVKQNVNDMIKHIKVELVNWIPKLSWMSPLYKKEILNTLNTIKMNFSNTEKDYDLYKLLNDGNQYNINMDFFNLYLNKKIWLKNLPFIELYGNPAQLDALYNYVMANTMNVVAVKEDVLAIPVSLLQSVHYSSERPMYCNYGSFGKIIGNELIYAIDKDMQLYKSNNKLLDTTITAFNNRTQCIPHNIGLLMSFEVLSSYTTQSKIAKFVGTSLAYKAYKNSEYNNREQSLVGIDYTPNQLFWISAALDQCFDANTDDDFGNELNYFRDNEIVRNNEDFARDFSCPLNSPMNPSEKCQLYNY